MPRNLHKERRYLSAVVTGATNRRDFRLSILYRSAVCPDSLYDVK